MQIIRGEKVSRLRYLLVIREKTFAIVQQFETPYNRKKEFAGKPSRLEANLQKPRKFSTANDLHYTVFPTHGASISNKSSAIPQVFIILHYGESELLCLNFII